MFALKVITCVLMITQALSKNYFCDLNCGNENTACIRERCPRGDKCGDNFQIMPLDDEARERILAVHNEYRNLVASGGDERGGNGKASNMNVLSYNKELEYVAQCWANSCETLHDECRTTKQFPDSVGQNLYWASSSGRPDYNSHKILERAVKSWYDEIDNTTAEIIDKYTKSNAKIGHFTQMLWSQTSRVGCGRTIFGDSSRTKVMVACNYGIGGNWIGSPVYLRGEPCSKCSQVCNKEYSSLCGNISDQESDNWILPELNEDSLTPSPTAVNETNSSSSTVVLEATSSTPPPIKLGSALHMISSELLLLVIIHLLRGLILPNYFQ